jgi:hypothetical protein
VNVGGNLVSSYARRKCSRGVMAVSVRKFTPFVPGIGFVIRHLTAENVHSLL